MNIEIVQGTREDRDVFWNLMQLYQYDFSEHSGEDPNEKGLFSYDILNRYWTDEGVQEGRKAFLIRVNGNLAGFALLHGFSYLDNPETEHTVAEFFVMRKWRRRGIGRLVALDLFRRFPGKWDIGQERKNVKAQLFWRQIINKFTHGHYIEVDSQPPGWDGPVQSFVSKPVGR